MNGFKLFIKSGKEYVKFPCTPVFPFSWGELLDERLDEAYVTIYDCRQENIPRLTEVKVTITNGEKTRDEYFIVASDNSIELPLGSKKYKHELYLIERTKLLEGIYCSSLTFTNAKAKLYTKNTHKAPPQDLSNEYEHSTALPSNFVSSIKAAIPTGTPANLPSAIDLAVEMLPLVKSNFTTNDGISRYVVNVSNSAIVGNPLIPSTMKTYMSKCEYTDSNSTKTYNYNQPVNPLPAGSITLTYTLCYSYYSILSNGVKSDTSYRAYFVRYQLGAVQNRLPLKRWSITDCITRCCELAEPLFFAEKPKYRLDGVEYDSDGNVIKPYPVGSLAEKYDKVFAPEFTLTEDTLREQLKVIFSYVHAEPWLDENDVIQATDYGGTQKSAASSLPYVYNAVSSHINEYCTEVRSHAQNLASSLGYAKGVMFDPGNGLYRSLRTDIAYSRITESNGIARTEKPIYEIQQVMCGIAKSDVTWNLSPVDITPYVFEATEYGANLLINKGGYPYSKAYAIYYTQGSPNLGGLFYKAPDNINTAKFSPFSISNILSAVSGVDVDKIDGWLVKEGAAQLVFSITYKPISNHFVSHGKQLYVKGEKPFMQLYNQSENLVESQYYGENLRGVAARLGNVEKERTFILKNIDDVPKVGQFLDGYAISAVSCELYPFDIKCTVGLSKDFNRISQYVGINSQKRMYEISERNATQRDILIKETLVIGTKPDKYSADGCIFKNLTPFYNIFDSDAENSDYKISLANLRTAYKSNKNITEVTLPVIARALGNMLTFNFATKDNYSAGNATQNINGDANVTGRWETDVPYTDYYGRAWRADVNLYGGDLEMTSEELISSSYKLPELLRNHDTPIIPLAGFTAHRLRKDNREVLAYNVELDIKTDRPDIIIGSALADLCGWVNDSNVDPVLYHFDASQYTVGKFDRTYTPHDNDVQAGGFEEGITGLWAVTKNADGSLTLDIVRQRIGYGWVLCTPIKTVTEEVEDEDGNTVSVTYQTGGDILLASNAPIDGSELLLDFYVVKN